MKRKITIANGFYSNPELEKEINTNHDEYQKMANNWGIVCAIQGTVKDDTSLQVVTESIHSNYDTLISKSNKKLDGTLGIAKAKLEIEKLESENEVLKSDASKLKNQCDIEKSKLGTINIPKIPYRQLIIGLFIGFFIWFFDAYITGTAFQATGSGLGFSLILGIGLSLAILIIATIGTAQIEKIESIGKRILLYLALILLLCISVYVLCEMRSNFYYTQTGHEMSPFKLMILNVLSFVGFHLIYKYILAPAIEILKERSRAKSKLQHLKKLKDEISKIEKVIENNNQTIVNIKHFRLSVLSYAKTLEDTICRYYREAISEFKKAFMEKAGYVPKCFHTELPGLNHFYTELSITPKTYETFKPLVVLTLLLSFFFAGCDKLIPERFGNCVGVIVDITDSLQVVNKELTIEKLKPMFAITNDYNASSRCILATITDLRYNEVSVISIKDDSYYGSNILQRNSLIKTFYQSVNENIEVIKKKPIGKNGSFVLYSIAKMLNDMAIGKNTHDKKIIVFSDLAENTPTFNIYKNFFYELMKKSPEECFKIFDREYPLPNLKGIEIIFINKPLDSKQDEQYHLLSQTLKTYYQGKGAKVTITASLPDGA